jgi:hypothetical protein
MECSRLFNVGHPYRSADQALKGIKPPRPSCHRSGPWAHRSRSGI